MKKIISLLWIAITLVTAAGCGGGEGAEIILVPDDMSPVAVYSMAANIAQDVNSYSGRSVQAEGEAILSEDSSTGYYIRISDSTACCFVDIDASFPDGIEPPEENSVFQLFGTISTCQNAEGKTVPRFDATKVLYEEELKEIYGEE